MCICGQCALDCFQPKVTDGFRFLNILQLIAYIPSIYHGYIESSDVMCVVCVFVCLMTNGHCLPNVCVCVFVCGRANVRADICSHAIGRTQTRGCFKSYRKPKETLVVVVYVWFVIINRESGIISIVAKDILQHQFLNNLNLNI